MNKDQDKIAKCLEAVNGKYNFAILMDNNRVYKWNDRPCFGEMRKYREKHGEDADWEDEMPDDLRKPYPSHGNPVLVAHNLNFSSAPAWVVEGIISEDSPWRNGYDKPTLIYKNNKPAILINHTDIDPTTFVSSLMMLNKPFWRVPTKLGELNIPFWKKIVISHVYMRFNNYYFSSLLNIDMFSKGNPNKIYKRKFKDRGDYCRTDIHNLFRCFNGNNINFDTIFPVTEYRPMNIEQDLNKILTKVEELGD